MTVGLGSVGKSIEISVLSVASSASLKLVLKTILNGCGISNVHEAEDIGTAFALTNEHRLDLVLVDDDLMHFDAVRVISAFRTGEGSPDPFIPIFLLCTNPTLLRVQSAINAGVHEIIRKPFTPTLLLTRIRQTLQNPRPFIQTKGYFGPDRRARPRGTRTADPQATAVELEDSAKTNTPFVVS